MDKAFHDMLAMLERCEPVVEHAVLKRSCHYRLLFELRQLIRNMGGTIPIGSLTDEDIRHLFINHGYEVRRTPQWHGIEPPDI